VAKREALEDSIENSIVHSKKLMTHHQLNLKVKLQQPQEKKDLRNQHVVSKAKELAEHDQATEGGALSHALVVQVVSKRNSVDLKTVQREEQDQKDNQLSSRESHASMLKLVHHSKEKMAKEDHKVAVGLSHDSEAAAQAVLKRNSVDLNQRDLVDKVKVHHRIDHLQIARLRNLDVVAVVLEEALALNVSSKAKNNISGTQGFTLG
jgi:hypothetical protein